MGGRGGEGGRGPTATEGGGGGEGQFSLRGRRGGPAAAPGGGARLAYGAAPGEAGGGAEGGAGAAGGALLVHGWCANNKKNALPVVPCGVLVLCLRSAPTVCTAFTGLTCQIHVIHIKTSDVHHTVGSHMTRLHQRNTCPAARQDKAAEAAAGPLGRGGACSRRIHARTHAHARANTSTSSNPPRADSKPDPSNKGPTPATRKVTWENRPQGGWASAWCQAAKQSRACI